MSRLIKHGFIQRDLRPDEYGHKDNYGTKTEHFFDAISGLQEDAENLQEEPNQLQESS
jgi:hypothetical protein